MVADDPVSSFAALLEQAENALELLAAHALAPPGIRGLKAELRKISEADEIDDGSDQT